MGNMGRAVGGLAAVLALLLLAAALLLPLRVGADSQGQGATPAQQPASPVVVIPVKGASDEATSLRLRPDGPGLLREADASAP